MCLKRYVVFLSLLLTLLGVLFLSVKLQNPSHAVEEYVLLTVSVSGGGSGRIYNMGEGTAYECSKAKCDYQVLIGSKLSFVASPSVGSTFRLWRLPTACRNATRCDFVVEKSGIVVEGVFTTLEQGDEECGKLNGVCMYGFPDVGADCLLDGNRAGEIRGGLCMSQPNNKTYRCCVPKPEEEDFVVSNRGCEEIGGECQRTNSLGECQFRDGVKGPEDGCYLFGLCRDKPQNFSEGDLWLCCAPAKEACENNVTYENWGNVHTNGKCPFSKPTESEERLACIQGPYTGSHMQKFTNSDNYASVDLAWVGNRPDSGTEYFIAPEDGVIERALQIDRKDNGLGPNGTKQRCGGTLIFKTNSGITYEIRHAFIFASILKNFTESGAGRVNVKKGEVIAKIANRTDGGIIDIVDADNTCSSTEHFHVKVSGVENCADCHFVDDLDCDFFNPSDPDGCGSCTRFNKINDCEYCEDCPDSSIQYCCETDCKVVGKDDAGKDVKECCKNVEKTQYDPRDNTETKTEDCELY